MGFKEISVICEQAWGLQELGIIFGKYNTSIMAGKITSRQLAPSRPLGELTLASRRSLTLANLALVTESCNLVGLKASIKTVEVIPRPEQWEASWGIPVRRRPLYSKAYCFPVCHCHSDSVAKAQPENEMKQDIFQEDRYYIKSKSIWTDRLFLRIAQIMSEPNKYSYRRINMYMKQVIHSFNIHI